MNANRVDVMSGWSLLLGGAIGVLSHVLHPAEPHSPDQIASYTQHTPAAHVLLGGGVLLVLLGLPGFYARAARTSTVLLISLPLIFVGLALADGMHSPLEFGALPAIYRVVPDRVGDIYQAFGQTSYGLLSEVGAGAMMLGLLLFAIGMWRSRLFPRWPVYLALGSLLGMAGALAGLPFVGLMFAVLFYAAFGVYGVLMLRSLRAPRGELT